MLVALKNFYLSKSLASNVVKVFLGSVLVAIAANIKLHIGIVPFTMQTMVILAISYALGSRLAVATLFAWFLQGLAGLPVFASGVGLSAVLGASGGYIVGFIAMAYVMGLAGDKKVSNVFALSIYALIATIALYAFGLFVLSFYVPSDKLLAVGLYPFILTDTVKAILAAILLAPICKFFQKL